MSRVRDLVQDRQLFYAEENQTVADVVRRMAEIHVGAILILDGTELRGVFSERDLMRRVVLERLDPETTLVRSVMSTDIVTIEESAPVEEAMEAMQQHSCRHLPVTRGGQVTAFLSMRDLMNFELARKTEELHHMKAYLHGSS
ncbi:MAG TPA: CBS domain-containing protein [Bryobacteraceae bacterium]|nr:CBS domain-containing protein [Bryobacteraceae bacterium]